MSKHDADYIARFQPTGLADWLVWLAMDEVKASQQARQAMKMARVLGRKPRRCPDCPLVRIGPGATLKPETIYVQDVPLSYFEYCLEHAETPEQRKELKAMIRQFKSRAARGERRKG